MLLLTGRQVGRRCAAATPDGVAGAGALPGARSAPARRGSRAGADRARRPRRSAVVSQRDARGRTVVHLAAAIRDQPVARSRSSTAIATWRMVHAAERAGRRALRLHELARRQRARPHALLRAKALAESAVAASSLRHTVFAPSLDLHARRHALTLLERAGAAAGGARSAAAGGARSSRSGPTTSPMRSWLRSAAAERRRARYELAGPADAHAQRARGARAARRRAPAPARPRPDASSPRASCVPPRRC